MIDLAFSLYWRFNDFTASPIALQRSVFAAAAEKFQCSSSGSNQAAILNRALSLSWRFNAVVESYTTALQRSAFAAAAAANTPF